MMLDSQKSAPKFSIKVVLTVVLLIFILASCRGAGAGGGSGPIVTDISDSAATARDRLEDDLSGSYVSDAEIEAIVAGAVSSIQAGTQGSTEAILGDLVDGAQRSLASLTLTDAEREAVIAAIVESAVGSVGVLDSTVDASIAARSVTASSISDQARIIAGIARRSVAALGSSGFTDADAVANAARVPGRTVVRSMRRAGIQSRGVFGVLQETSRRIFSALGAGGITSTQAAGVAQNITSDMTGALDDARIDGVDLNNDLPELVREITAGAASAVGNTGIGSLDNSAGIPGIVTAITRSATSAVRDLDLNTYDSSALEATLARLVREVTSATTYALRQADAEAAAGVTISLTVNVGAVVDGASYAVADLSDRFGTTVSIGTVANEIVRGASEGSRRLAGEDEALFGDLEAEITARITDLEDKIDELTTELADLKAQIERLLDEGASAAANDAPAASLLVSYDTSESGPDFDSDAPFIDVPLDTSIKLDASASSDGDDDSLEWVWRYVEGPAGSVTFYRDDVLATPGIGISGLYDTLYVSLTRPGDYYFSLSVEDDDDLSRIYFVLSVAGADADNNAPVAIAVTRAGTSESSIFAVDDTVSLYAGGSSDIDGDTLSYRWTIHDAPADSTARISSADTIEATLIPDTAGGYVVELQVDDGSLVSVDYASFTATDGGGTHEAEELTSGMPVSNRYISTVDQEDWYRIATTAGDLIRFRITQSESAVEPDVELYAPSDLTTPVHDTYFNSDPLDVTSEWFPVEESGFYYLRVSDHYSRTDVDVPYIITLATTPEPEAVHEPANNDWNGAEELLSGELASERFISHTEDEDWHKMEVTAGDVVRFRITQSTSDVEPDIELYAPSDLTTPVHDTYFNSDPLDFTSQWFPVTESGFYYVRVSDHYSRTDVDVPYTITLYEAEEPEATNELTNNEWTGAEELFSSVAASNRYISHTEDEDWYKMEVTAGELIQIDLTQPESEVAPQVALFTPSSLTSAVWSTQSGSEPCVISSPYQYVEESGSYYLRVTGYYNNSDIDTPYSLTVTVADEPGPNEPANNTTTGATTLTDGEAYTSDYISYEDDADWYKIAVTAGELVQIDLTQPESEVDPQVALFKPSNLTSAVWSTQSGSEPCVITSPLQNVEESGFYYIRLTCYYDNADISVPYSLTVTVTTQ